MPVRCVIDAKNRLGETPLWCDRTQALWWIDIERPTLHRFDPLSKEHTSHVFDTRFLGSLALCESGKFLVALNLSLYIFDPKTAQLTQISSVEHRENGTRLNDGRCDSHGRFWVGTMDIAFTQPKGSLYRLDPNGSITSMVQGIKLINSIAIAPDQQTLYCSDTRSYVLWAFDLDIQAGTLSRQRVFIDYAGQTGRPDGACVDTDGFLWVALFAGSRIVRYTPEGTIDRTIDLPISRPTSLCFGGPDLTTLYITTARSGLTAQQLRDEPLAGALLAIDIDYARGLPEARFAA